MTQRLITDEQAQQIANTLIACSKVAGIGWAEVNPALCILHTLPKASVAPESPGPKPETD